MRSSVATSASRDVALFGGPNGLMRPGIAAAEPVNELAPRPTAADAYDANAQAVERWLTEQQQISADRGLWQGGGVLEGGHPTAAGVVDAAGQTVNALLMGTTAPRAAPSLSLERTTLPREWAQPNNHKFTITQAGEEVGTVHTEWNPQTGELYVQDIEGHRGPQSFGPAAIRQLREALLEHYPEARTLAGYRSTGAGPNREAWQRVNQYQGRGE